MADERDQTEAQAFLVDAVRAHQRRSRANGWSVPPGVARLVADAVLGVSEGQGGSRDAGSVELSESGRGLKLVVDYEAAARMLGVSMSTLKRLLRDEALPSVRIGGCARVRVADLESYVAGLSPQVAS